VHKACLVPTRTVATDVTTIGGCIQRTVETIYSRIPAAWQNPVSKSGKKYPVIGCWFLQISIDKTGTQIKLRI